MFEMLILCNLFILPVVLLVGASELRRKYRALKEKNADNPGTVPASELKKWKWISIFATIVFWCIIAMIVTIPILFFVAISFM